MHIEKNICDNIVGTLLELEGRNKDTVSARIDLKKFKIWEKYWLKKIVKDDDDAAVTYAKPLHRGRFRRNRRDICVGIWQTLGSQMVIAQTGEDV